MDFGSIPIAFLVKAAVVMAGTIIFAVTARNIHIKYGDKEFSFQSKEKIKGEVAAQTVRVVTEYADFRYALKEERDKEICDMHVRAKWLVTTRLDSYYQTVIERMSPFGPNVTRLVAVLSEGVRPRQVEFLMSIYEQNHLGDKSDEEVRLLVEERYPILGNLFRAYAQTYWINEGCDVSELFKVFENERAGAKTVMQRLLSQFRDLSRSKAELYRKVDALDEDVRGYVLANAKLPPDAMKRCADIHHDGIGRYGA